jgi:diguanylate cyclase (GGDEF)-like protein/PAS domain S-box-containing protein
MTLHELWIPLAALAILVLYQQLRLYRIDRTSKNREELFQIVTENAADMIALVDIKGRRLYNSPAYKKILGYSAAELGETSAFEQIHPDDRFKVLEAAREARETGIGKQLEYRIKHKDGSWRVLESIASTIRDQRGEVARLVIVNRDITQRKRAEQQLEHNLFHDTLTGLPNRRLFLDRLHHCFALAQRDPTHTYALLLANLDHFKDLNRTLSPAAGDQMLTEIARRIGASLRQEDTVSRRESGSPHAEPILSRVGGDEFTILLDAVADPSDALRVAQRIQTAVAAPFLVSTAPHSAPGPGSESREVRATISLGIALSMREHAQPEDLLKDADAAMRRAKALGGSRCEVFDEAMHTRAVGRLRLEADLRTAINQNQFRVYYQPVVQLENRRVVSFEALLRWNHPEKGLISPYRFLEAAEDSGLLITIGHWLLLQACQQVRAWDSHNFTGQPIRLTVNLSARQFANPRLASDINEALRQTGLDPARLQVEVPEGVATADPKFTLTVLSHLKHLGMGVVLDDFGAGSASLRGLWQFPVDALKIDCSLIRELPTERAASDIVELIIEMARKRHIKVIAEGIEAASLAERLREMGCEFGQGYCFSPPLEAPAALQFLQKPPAAHRAGAT